MLLCNSIRTASPYIVESLKDRITLLSTCVLSEKEQIFFGKAFAALAAEIDKCPPPCNHAHVNIIFADNDFVNIQVETNEMGLYVPIIIYPLHKIRAANYTDLKFYAIIFEELAHCFWFIRDEYLVQDKVIDLLRHISPNVQKSDVYNMCWSLNDQ